MSGLEDGEHVNSEKYPRRFGKDLVILDVDTRPWNNTNPANMSYITWGRTNHYLYSQIHGYDYKFVQAPLPAEDLHYTWVKVPAIREVLKSNYKFIVFIDSDALFPHLKIPLEYLIDYWNITSDIALAVGLAQPDKINFDRFHHKQTDNTGFMVVQNIPAAHDLFKDWDECPTDVKYKDCSHWKKIRLHEQNAYSDYIRYDYADVVRELPCDEVNGWSQHRSINGGHCSGQLVRHQVNTSFPLVLLRICTCVLYLICIAPFTRLTSLRVGGQTAHGPKCGWSDCRSLNARSRAGSYGQMDR
ncbi:hypothetical protein K461DRAFT_230306 [Myriangium duriaei CBS 260.36]|uniref:Nucleotide-diphospho-sugar transferase domain-containing protein n=1 Tax=Myriangium duriaei CBS 260.36 TaxID=1168546 RepID=A0A9P4MDR1_9PEZI|nr:hypothetical protein K461DRAFT_230306 [Myriangium duriaei CBS 260.36]